MTEVGPKIFFAAQDAPDGETTSSGLVGRELWILDSVTGQLDVININQNDQDPVWEWEWVHVGGNQLKQVYQMTQPGQVAGSHPVDLTVVGNCLFFRADDGTGSGRKLFRYDTVTGSPPEVVTSGDVTTTYVGKKILEATGDKLYFVALDAESVKHMMCYSDDTGNIQRVNDPPALSTAADDSNLYYFKTGDSSRFFCHDGTRNFLLNAETWTEYEFCYYPKELTAIDVDLDGSADYLYWTADRIGDSVDADHLFQYDVAAGTLEQITSADFLYQYDITDGMLHEVVSSNLPADNPTQLVSAAGRLYFTGFSSEFGNELYELRWSDVNGNLVRQISLYDIFADDQSAEPDNFTSGGDSFFFTAASDLTGGQRSPMKLDATGNIISLTNGAPGADSMIWTGSMLFFNDAADGGLWVSDTTQQGTMPVADKALSTNNSFIVKVLAGEGDLSLSVADGDPAAAVLNSATIPMNTFTGGNRIALDLTDLIKEYLDTGRTRMTLRIEQTGLSGSLPIEVYSLSKSNASSSLEISTFGHKSVVGDLYGEDGAIIASGEELIDMSSLAAGAYFLRVHDPYGSATALPFSIEIELPKSGEMNLATDNDALHGGEW